MKNLLFILLLSTSVCAFSQSNVASKQFSTISDLRLQGGMDGTIVNVSGLATANDKNGGNYYWNASSTSSDDGITVIKVTAIATGRWIKMTNDNTIKGGQVLSGTVLQTAYPITYGQTLPFTPAMIIVQAYSANAAVPSWVSNVTTTGFTVNFASIPIVGTNNLSITYIIIKL